MPLVRAAERNEPPDEPRDGLAAVREAARDGAVGTLVEILACDPDKLAREAALTSLARLGGDAAIAALVQQIGSDDPELRNAVIETLPSLGVDVIDFIEPLLLDADPNLRISALTVLENIDDPRAAAVALSVALGDANVNVCATAIEVVANSGGPDMAAPLQTVPARFPDHPFLAFAVRAALKKIG